MFVYLMWLASDRTLTVKNKTMNTIYKTLLRLDCAVLVSDSALIKLLKRKILKPVGFYFRKKHFNAIYK